MPRRNKPEPDMLEDAHGNPVIPVIVTSPKGDRERRIDPYMALPGGAPPAPHPSAEHKGEKKSEALVKAEAKARANRYDRYLDALIATGGDSALALSQVFNLDVADAEARYDVLIEEVKAGIGQSSLADLLERRDLDQAARLSILRRHAFSPIPAASLKAIDMINDMDNRPGQSAASYESYVRLILEQ